MTAEANPKVEIRKKRVRGKTKRVTVPNPPTCRQLLAAESTLCRVTEYIIAAGERIPRSMRDEHVKNMGALVRTRILLLDIVAAAEGNP